MKIIGLGLIGCGHIGPAHLTAATKTPLARLVAVADIVEEKAKKAWPCRPW